MKSAKVDDPATFAFLRTVPGIGPILGLVMLYEIDAIGRFAEVGNFLSYARLVTCTHESAGKVKGVGGRKIGNAHLKWAFAEAASLMLRSFAAGEGVDAAAVEEARGEEGPRHPGGEDRAGRLPPVAEAGGVRRHEVPGVVSDRARSPHGEGKTKTPWRMNDHGRVTPREIPDRRGELSA